MTTLKNALLINSISSGATGVLLALMPSYLATLFGISQTLPFLETGIFLILFATLVAYASQQNPFRKNLIISIIIIDISWVGLSLLIVFPQLFGLSMLGYGLISAVAIWVAMMAYLQINGLKNLSESSI